MLHLGVNSFACAPPSSLTKEFVHHQLCLLRRLPALPQTGAWKIHCQALFAFNLANGAHAKSSSLCGEPQPPQQAGRMACVKSWLHPVSTQPVSTVWSRSSLQCFPSTMGVRCKGTSLEADEADSDSECISSDMATQLSPTMASWQAKTQTCPQRQCLLTRFRTLLLFSEKA